MNVNSGMCCGYIEILCRLYSLQFSSLWRLKFNSLLLLRHFHLNCVLKTAVECSQNASLDPDLAQTEHKFDLFYNFKLNEEVNACVDKLFNAFPFEIENNTNYNFISFRPRPVYSWLKLEPHDMIHIRPTENRRAKT